MRKLNVFYFFLIFSVFSCRNIKTFPPNEHFDAEKETSENLKEKLFSISGFVTHSSSYCGGARPTNDILMEITSPRPNPNATFYVRRGKFNDISEEVFCTFSTDENGNFSFKLPPGDYVILEKNRVDSLYYKQVVKTYSKESDSYSAVDTSCMNNWLKESLTQISITTKDLENINWNIHKACWTDAPCIQYKGPYTP
jgi:hypothetical protein